MKYIQFISTDEKGINDFISKHETKIAENGVRMIGDKVCILYSDTSQEEYLKTLCIQSLENLIAQSYVALVGEVQKEFLWLHKKLAAKDAASTKAATDLQKDSKDKQEFLKLEISFYRSTIEEIKSGKISFK